MNNAERKQVPKKFHQLHKMINEYFDSTRDISKHPQEALVASTVYMWSLKLPLFEYRNGLFKNDSNATELKKWASMGPLYRSYGSYIITQYPFKFLQHFIIPNAGKYYAPPVEFLEQYNSGNEDVTTQAKEWFNYKSTKVHTRTKNNWVTVLDHYPILSGIVNVLMLFGLIFYLILKGWRSNSDLSKGIFLGAMVWLLNAGFTIFASSAALRFQSFPILLTTVTVALLIDWLWKMAMKTESKIKEASNENKVVVVSPTTIA
ncbi:hypothetical protein [Longitalea luteola]|uniref:hypothetical protein n=1 Tax=Longitalea luteola TaxID=2812563 RepID=UPI001A97A783|nr:hypothetical protein [Longitalea luteola]